LTRESYSKIDFSQICLDAGLIPIRLLNIYFEAFVFREIGDLWEVVISLAGQVGQRMEVGLELDGGSCGALLQTCPEPDIERYTGAVLISK
jgi:hypothetical protein